MLFFHGPGGIGKTTLLHELRSRASDGRRIPVVIDGRDIDASPTTFEAAMRDRLPRGSGIGDVPGLVLLVDGYELIEGIDDWMRTELVPSLPADVVVVLAGREPPAAAWRSDTGWRELVAVQALSVLDAEESRELLERAGVDDERAAGLAELGHGYPLALALLADVALTGELPRRMADSPDLVGALLRVLVSEVPDETHAVGLAVCAAQLDHHRGSPQGDDRRCRARRVGLAGVTLLRGARGARAVPP